MANYFVSDSRGDHGPYPPDQLPGQGVTADTLVWCEGMADWQKAGAIPELSPYLVAPRPQTYAAPQQPYAAQQQSYGTPQQDPNLSQGYSQTVPYTTPMRQGGNGLGITSLILGIVSLVFGLGTLFWCCGIISIPSGIIAIILGFMAQKNPNSKGFALGGMIMGGIGLLVSVIWIIILIIFVANSHHR